MNAKRQIKFASLIIIGITLGQVVQAKDDMYWYRHDMVCDDTKVTIRSYCQEDSNPYANTFCTKQNILLEKDGQKKTVNPVKWNTLKEEYVALSSLTCVVAKNQQHYLLLKFSNGGNCRECEALGTIDLNGNWKHFRNRWFTNGKERKMIDADEALWWRQEGLWLSNKVRDAE